MFYEVVLQDKKNKFGKYKRIKIYGGINFGREKRTYWKLLCKTIRITY